MFTLLPNSSHTVPSASRDTTNVSKMGPTITVGLPKLRVPRKNPPDRSALPRANKVRDKVTQRVTSSWRFPRPHRGDPTSTTRPRFVSGRHLPLFGPMERYIFPYWFSPAYADPCSTQILTRCHSAKSMPVILLTNVGTTPIRQVQRQFSPSGLLKHLRMGSVRTSHTFLTTRMDSGAPLVGR
jgi:hypothetical protein